MKNFSWRVEVEKSCKDGFDALAIWVRDIRQEKFGDAQIARELEWTFSMHAMVINLWWPEKRKLVEVLLDVCCLTRLLRSDL